MVKVRTNEINEQQNSQKDRSDDNQKNEQERQQMPDFSQKIQPNIKTIQYRKKRGERMEHLMNKKKKQQDDDAFWKNNAYFGNVEESSDDEDQEDYVENSSGKDEFDSDFLQSQSQDQKKRKKKKVNQMVDQSQRRKRGRPRIHDLKPPHKKVQWNGSAYVGQSATANNKFKLLSLEEIIQNQIPNLFKQEEVQANNKSSQYCNYLQLQKLLSIQQKKKILQQYPASIQFFNMRAKGSTYPKNNKESFSLVRDQIVDQFKNIKDFEQQ